jgi:hypothetical protein
MLNVPSDPGRLSISAQRHAARNYLKRETAFEEMSFGDYLRSTFRGFGITFLGSLLGVVGCLMVFVGMFGVHDWLLLLGVVFVVFGGLVWGYGKQVHDRR